ncbi:MAG: hypothetical protein QOC56_1377 [Alphaproteobacteria bacterium]|nr:hypothetical protein [Alphaproteobacteria bacterium]
MASAASSTPNFFALYSFNWASLYLGKIAKLKAVFPVFDSGRQGIFLQSQTKV